VSTGASYDGARSGRTHQAPADVALLSALPGWTIHVPGHPDELERALRAALATDDRVYIRMSEEANAAAVHGDGLTVVRDGSDAAPVVLAVGPTLDPTLAAARDLDVTVAYMATLRPFQAGGPAGGGGAARGRRRPDRRSRGAVSGGPLGAAGQRRARRPAAPPSRDGRPDCRVPPLRHGRRAPRRPRSRRGGHRPLAAGGR